VTKEPVKRILIVEDHYLNMKLLTDLLRTGGYCVVQAHNGIEGLEMARRYRPDLILLDIQLPDISGVEVTKRIKGDDDLKHIPVVAVTAFAMRGDERKILAAGCDGDSTKPISTKTFLASIEQFLK
jgi:two-component system, cell cycle response regulator DivK